MLGHGPDQERGFDSRSLAEALEGRVNEVQLLDVMAGSHSSPQWSRCVTSGRS